MAQKMHFWRQTFNTKHHNIQLNFTVKIGKCKSTKDDAQKLYHSTGLQVQCSTHQK